MKINIILLAGGFMQISQSSQIKSLPVLDLSADSTRHIIITQGTEDSYNGHPTTTLLLDVKTMFCVWAIDDGGPCGPMKKSQDGGLTWSEFLLVPKSWSRVKNCPIIYQLPDFNEKSRLFVFAGEGSEGNIMQHSYSDNNGKTWSEMKSNELPCVMPFCTIKPIQNGKKLLGLTNIRHPGDIVESRSNIVTQSISNDGGFTWSPWKIIADVEGLKLYEPYIVRSPSGKQLLCLLRENVIRESYYMTGDGEGTTWSAIKRLPKRLYGDRHVAKYTHDCRLVIVFRDTGKESPTNPHFVAWIGKYDNIIDDEEGQYKRKLLYSYKGEDNAYPGLELLADGTFIATLYYIDQGRSKIQC